MFTLNPAPKPSYGRNKPTAKQRGAISPKVRNQLKERSNGVCERCRKAWAIHAAHLVRRWQLQETTVELLAHLCLECHIWADNCQDGRDWLEQFKQTLEDSNR